MLEYFQPETERLEESVRIFEMGRVTLDYTHIKPGDPGYGFARNTVSIDYGQAVQIGATIGPIQLLTGADGYVKIVPMERAEPVKATQIRMF